MNGKKYDVVTVGIQCIDIVASPVAAGVLDRELTLSASTQLMLGGDALNQAVVLARLGAKVGLMGVAGKDRLGNVLTEQLAEFETLDVLNKRADVNTAISLVLIDEKGERHFVYQPESNLALCYDHIDKDAVQNTAFLSIGGCLSLPGLDGKGTVELLKLAKEYGAQTALDFRISDARPNPDTLREILSLADYVLPSEREAEALTGEDKSPEIMALRLRSMGAKNCVVKLGSKGCYVAADGYEGYVASYPCNCVDTTGAGDTFVGAFLYAKTKGWEIERCAKFACAAGSIAVEHTGANTAIQSIEQIEARMRIKP